MTLDDDAVKIILSTKGTMDDVSPEMKRILDYIDGKGASDKFTEELEEAVRSARQNESWRLGYMTKDEKKDERKVEKERFKSYMNGVKVLHLLRTL